MEVITRAVAKLSLDWPAECHVEPQRGKLFECFLRFKTSPPHRSLPFFTLRCGGRGENLSRPASSSPFLITIGAFPLRGTTRFGTARNGTARFGLRFHCSLVPL